MEMFVLTATAIGSFGILSLRLRARAFYAIFLHLLLVLTVGSLAFRTLSGGGVLLTPFVEGWHKSPFMHLTSTRVYIMVGVSLLTAGLVFTDKVRILRAVPIASIVPPAKPSFLESTSCCLLLIWIHLLTIVCLLAA